jgi:hypothetical protein
MTAPPSTRIIKAMARPELVQFVDENVHSLLEDEAVAVLENRFVTPAVCQKIAQTQRLTSFYDVRLRLVAHRQTPQAYALKFVHHLYWTDLLRLSVDVKVPAPVRRAIDHQLANRAEKMTVGERITAAKSCSHTLIKLFLFDESTLVFEALLVNPRVREEDLVTLANSSRATAEQLQILARDPKWLYRYPIRKAIVMNPATPRATAASLLRHLSRRDLESIHDHPQTSVYLRRCIERLRSTSSPAAELGS